MKKCRIYSYQSINDPKKDIKSDSIKHLEFMSKACPNILLIPINPSRRRWKKEEEIDPLPPLR